MYVDVLPAHVSVHHVHAWFLGSPEEGAGPMELELQTIVTSHVGAGN